MDAKAITRKGEDLTKAANASEPASVLLPMLSDLRTGVKASEDILRSTKIGIIVNKLRSNKDPAVAREANDLVQKWRNDVKGAKASPTSSSAKATALDAQKKAAAATKDGSATPQPQGQSQTSSSSQSAASKEEKKGGGEEWRSTPSEKRTTDTDKVDKNVHGSDQARNTCFGLLYNGLAFLSDQPPSRIQAVALEIESAAWKLLASSGTATPAYKNKIKSLFQNLKSKTSRHLSTGLLAQPPKITPAAFVRMSAEELKSEERKAEDEKLRLENLHDAAVPEKVEAISQNIQCGKCKQWKVRYSTAQTRSADEPMTQFCTCTVCGNNWKM